MKVPLQATKDFNLNNQTIKKNQVLRENHQQTPYINLINGGYLKHITIQEYRRGLKSKQSTQ